MLAKFELQHVPMAVPNFFMKTLPLKVKTLFDSMCCRNSDSRCYFLVFVVVFDSLNIDFYAFILGNVQRNVSV